MHTKFKYSNQIWHKLLRQMECFLLGQQNRKPSWGEPEKGRGSITGWMAKPLEAGFNRTMPCESHNATCQFSTHLDMRQTTIFSGHRKWSQQWHT